jgi:hypothetical protein
MDDLPSELEMFSNEELISELMNRQTFVGLLIASNAEQLQDGQVHDDFRVHSNLGGTENIIEMMEVVVGNLKLKP